MSESLWIYLDINPEPWAVGPLSLGRKNGKMYPRMGRNNAVHTFKEEVRAELEDRKLSLPEGLYDLQFFFWRRLDSYVSESGRKASAHVADATNMQKALEDALQGVLIGNDRDVRHVESEIVEQGPDVKPCIVIRAETWQPIPIHLRIPLDIMDSVRATAIEVAGFNNDWSGPS